MTVGIRRVTAAIIQLVLQWLPECFCAVQTHSGPPRRNHSELAKGCQAPRASLDFAYAAAARNRLAPRKDKGAAAVAAGLEPSDKAR